jgi:hypothetical protein
METAGFLIRVNGSEDNPTSSFQKLSSSNDAINKIKSLNVAYDEEIQKVKVSAPLRKNSDRNLNCFYNGWVSKEITSSKISFLVCRCDEKFLGENCEIPKELYDSTQLKLAGFIDKMESEMTRTSINARKKVLSALILMNKFKIGSHLIERLIGIIINYLRKDKDLDNQKKLYLLFDNILAGLFKILEDMKKSKSDILNTDFEDQEKHIYDMVYSVIDIIEDSLENNEYLQSLIETNYKSNLGLQTKSFVIEEFIVQNEAESQMFFIPSPSIQKSSNESQGNRVILKRNNSKDQIEVKTNIQLLILSSSLLEDKYKSNNVAPISNVMYLKYISPKFPHKSIKNQDIGLAKLVIQFSLNFVPAFENVLDNIACTVSNFGLGKPDIKGDAVDFDEDTMVVTCEYSPNFDFKNYYFAVTLSRFR